MSLRRQLITQFHHPDGLWGHAAGWIMAHRASNLARNRWTIDLLELKPSDAVCELGPGPGITLGILLAELDKLEGPKRTSRLIAVDHSALMLKKCGQRHKSAITQGRLELYQADFSQLPEFGLVDKIIAVNALQFDALNESALLGIAAHLKPGGKLAVTFQPRSRTPTEQQVDEAAARTAQLLCNVGLTKQEEHRLALEPVSAACIIASSPNATTG